MNPKTPDLHTLLAASSYLMTRYTLRGCADTAAGVVHHLEMLLAHPEVQTSSVAQCAYCGLLREWRAILNRHRGRPAVNETPNTLVRH